MARPISIPELTAEKKQIFEQRVRAPTTLQSDSLRCCIAHLLVAPLSHWAGGMLLPERKDPEQAKTRIDDLSAA